MNPSSDRINVEPSHLGQELEYRIAALLLSVFDKPTVVDVGVERGSFVELALRSGASAVIGYEPLPRHVEHLTERFAAEPRVQIHPLAISNACGTAKLHVATDLLGRELDFYHSLDELGDSPEIIRSQRTLEVRTAALGQLARDGLLPERIDFLKIDTDGHDLAVLEGLGQLRPRAIMAEYWDTLPKTSGRNPFTIAGLASWARTAGYSRMLVVRHNEGVDLVQDKAPWSIAGDWGNVFFLADDFDFSKVEAQFHQYCRQSHQALCGYVSNLVRETEAKESEIRTLDTALQQARTQILEQHSAIQQLLKRLGQPDA